MADETLNIHHLEHTQDHDFDHATIERMPHALVARHEGQVVVTALIDDYDRAASLVDLLNKMENGTAVIIDLTQLGKDSPVFVEGNASAGEDPVADELARETE